MEEQRNPRKGRKSGKTNWARPALPTPIPEWLVYLDQEGKSGRTIQTYAEDLRDFVQWYTVAYGDEFDAPAIIPRDIEDYKAHTQTVRRAAPRTINHRLAALSQFFKWATGQGMAQRDPTAGVRALRLPPRRPKALTPQEERRLRREVYRADDLRDVAIVEVLLGTGIRVGELLDLTRGDIVLNDRSGALIVRRGKGGQPRRVPLRADVRKALDDYLGSLGEELDTDSPLWHGIRGPLTNPSGINRLIGKYAEAAKTDGVTPHSLRHTFATRYLEANPDDLRGLAALLGHASLNTVMIYTEPSEDELRKRMERMTLADSHQAT